MGTNFNTRNDSISAAQNGSLSDLTAEFHRTKYVAVPSPDFPGHFSDEALFEATQLRNLGKKALNEWSPQLQAEWSMREEVQKLMKDAALFDEVRKVLPLMNTARPYTPSVVIDGTLDEPRVSIDHNYSIQLYDVDGFSVNSGIGDKASNVWFPRPFHYAM